MKHIDALHKAAEADAKNQACGRDIHDWISLLNITFFLIYT